MRIVPPALVLHRRGYLRLGIFTGVLAVGLLGACAKFPPGGANSNFTKVTFSFTMGTGHINQNYVYIVAIRSSVLVNPTTQNAPLPVFDPTKNPNGFVAGSPTQFIQFNPLNEVNQPFTLDQFATQAQDPNPSDPTNAVNLAVYNQSTAGIITDFTPVNAGTPLNPGTSNSLTFSVFINLLPDITQPTPTTSTPNSQIPQTLQVQFLTMNSTGGGSGRTIDYIGTPPTPEFLSIDLRTAGTYSNDAGIYNMIEPTGDCADPDLDITDWSITVAPP